MIKLGTHGVELEAGVNVVNTLASSMSRGKYSMAAAVLLGLKEGQESWKIIPLPIRQQSEHC